MDELNKRAGQNRGRYRRGYKYPYYFNNRNGRFYPRRKAVNQWNQTGINVQNSTSPAATVKRTFPPECYVAPKSPKQVKSVIIESPASCPGWQLYFPWTKFVAGCELEQKIEAFKLHCKRNPQNYSILISKEIDSLPVNATILLNDLKLCEAWPTLFKDMQQNPLSTIATMAAAVHSIVCFKQFDESTEYRLRSLIIPKIYLIPENFVPVELISNISYGRLGTLFSVRGIVSTVNNPTYEMGSKAYKCITCNAVISVQGDVLPGSRQFGCSHKNCRANFGYKLLRSSPYTRLRVRQVIKIEESSISLLSDHKTTNSGCLDIELRHNLVDTVCLGEEVVVTGLLKLHSFSEDNHLSTKSTESSLHTYLQAISLQKSNDIKHEFSEYERETIWMVKNDPNKFKLLVQSLTPELHGLELAKAACFLSLLNVAESRLINETRIHILLVGDPGIGKSKIMKTCCEVAERSAYVSSKHALTLRTNMAVTLTGSSNFITQAGPILMSNSSGHCIIEDIHKITHPLLLQSLQSGEINFPLSGIYMAFVTRPSIITSTIPHQGTVGIPSELSREFQLIFYLRDRPTKISNDVALAEHVSSLHTGDKKQNNISVRYSIKQKIEENESIASFNRSLKNTEYAQEQSLKKRLSISFKKDDELELLPPILIKKIIGYMRQNIKPLLSSTATKFIKKMFMELGHQTDENDVQVQNSISQLMVLLYLSQARARLELSDIIEPEHITDVQVLLAESNFRSTPSSSINNHACGPNPRTSHAKQIRCFIQVLNKRSVTLGRRIFEFQELKDICTEAGITMLIDNVIQIVNMQGYLLKKGSNIYEYVTQ